jgi:monothiol glutaredoxin
VRWQQHSPNCGDKAASFPGFSYNGALTLSEAAMSDDVQSWIKETVTQNPVVLFMKGTAQFPQCGFSGKAIQLLKESGVQDLVTVNVLDDAEVRQGIKDFSNWPTVPQLYVKGEFIGGSDIMNEMFESGELQALLKA